MNTVFEHCWNKIGVSGDSSCPELKNVVHCRNCSVYGSAGRNLLQREAPKGYVEEWTNLLTQDVRNNPKESQASAQNSSVIKKQESSSDEPLGLIIFRVCEEWLALPVWVVKEITHVSSVHILPHRSNHVFAGIVNIRGEILMCILLRNLLGLPCNTKGLKCDGSSEYNRSSCSESNTGRLTLTPVTYQRMMVLEIQGNRWVFPVEEVLGIQRFSSEQLKEPPVVISKTPDTYTKKIIIWDEKQVNYLDYELIFYELLFYTLNRS